MPLLFFGILGAAVLVHWLLVPPRYRLHVILLASLAWAALRTGPFFPLLIALVAVTYLCARGIAGGRRGWLVAALLVLIGTLAAFKALSTLSAPGRFLFLPVGLSYVTFRLIHMVVDVYFGRLEALPLTRLLAYTLFFPTFVSGPVDRYQRFEVAQGRLDRRDLNVGLLRIAAGVAKKALVADPLRILVYPHVARATLSAPLSLAAVSYGVLGTLYLDFSAYSDIAIGSSLLLGIKVMENFDYPLLKPSLPQFWRSWHISVYNFIRDYFLLPLFASRGSEVKLYCGLVLAFVVFMLWHRISPVFFGLGLYLGLPVAGTAAFARLAAGRPRLRRVIRHPALRPLLVALTVTYIAVGTYILHWDGYLTGTLAGGTPAGANWAKKLLTAWEVVPK